MIVNVRIMNDNECFTATDETTDVKPLPLLNTLDDDATCTTNPWPAHASIKTEPVDEAEDVAATKRMRLDGDEGGAICGN